MGTLDYSLLKKLCTTHAVNGDSSIITDTVMKEVQSLGIEVHTHGYGSLYFGNTQNPEKMVVAHIDEVGFQVSHIDPNGHLRIMPAGWVFPNRLDHALVYIYNGKDYIKGLIIHHDILKSENVQDFDLLTVDIGADSAEEVENMGVRVGQFGSFQKNFHETSKAIIASSIDNKISQFVVLTLLKEQPELAQRHLFVFNIDEETQDHDARGICKAYKPDLALILDYCPIHQKRLNGDQLAEVNEGPLVMYRGGAYVLHERARNYFDTKVKSPFKKGFLSPATLPSLEPAFYEENTHTIAVNICIPAMGYHGAAYSIRKNDIERFSAVVSEVLNTPFR